MLRSCAIGAIAIGLLASTPAASRAADSDADTDDYRDDLVARALALELHEDPQWRTLLHYEKRPLRPLRSQAKSAHFFTDLHGATDPRRELVATLLAFFEDSPRAGADDPPQCAFVARFHWLDEQLDFDRERMPRQDCANFRAWRERLPAGRLTLIFPESFIDNPASLFGHTLLRLDRAEDEASKLLGYAIDFSGDIGEDGAIAYLAKGPIGMYPGYFAIGVYYEKLRRYADWENRDIWEYSLDLRRDELDFLLMHLWELRGVAFPYYFFDDNCSYQLLRLLEVVRPESRLGDGFPLQVLPVDTVRAVARAGWVTAVLHRPSPASELRAAGLRLSGSESGIAKSLAAGEMLADDPRLTELPREQQAELLTVAYQSLKYDFLAGRTSQDASRTRSRQLLIARSRLGRITPTANATPDSESPAPPTRPDHGHGTARISLAGGSRDGDGFVELRLRPALHDFLDPPEGHAAGNRVSVLDTRIRYLPEKNRVRLEQLVVLDVASMSPRDRFLRPIAWKLDTGLRTRLVADPSPGDDFDPEPVWRTNGGIGLAAAPTPAVLVYGLGETMLDVGTALEHDASFGPGASAGVYLDGFDRSLRTHLYAAITRFLVGDRTTWYRGGLEQRVRLGAPVSLELDLSANRIDGDEWYEAGISLSFYF